MTKFFDLPTDQQFFIRQKADAMNVNPALIADADIDLMLEHFKPANGWFEKEYRSNEIISVDRRKRAEAASDFPLPSDSEVADFAKKYGVVASLVPTVEKRAAEELAERQRQDYETAAEAEDTYTLVAIGNDRDHPHWEAARLRVAEFFPSFDSWSD